MIENLLPWPAADVIEQEQHDRHGTIITMMLVHPADGTRPQPMVLKQYRPDDEEGDGTWAADVGRRLEQLGMCAPALDRVAVTHGVRPGALLCERAPGESWRSTVGTAQGVSAAHAVGRWVATLQRQPLHLPEGTRRGPADTQRQLGALLQDGAVDTARVRAAGEHLLRELAAPQPHVPSHGNLHPDNLFVHEQARGVVVIAIDLDTVAARESAYDVGYGVAQLVIRSLRRPGREHGQRAARGLIDGYLEHRGAATPERIALQAARAVLQALHFEAVGMRQPLRANAEYLPLLEGLLDHGLGALQS